MKTLLYRLFIANWQRKLASLILAMIVWMIVNHSMISSKTVHNVPVRIKNIPSGKTIDGLQSNGTLNKRISLTITGIKSTIDDLNGEDFEVILDASEKEGEWIASISKKNINCLSPNIDLKSISKINQHDFIVKMSNLVIEKIPVLITKPIGEPPRGYQFLDVWPYKLTLTLKGPEDHLKRLKARGIKITYNLNDISRQELDRLYKEQGSDEISYLVPRAWKKVSIPYLNEYPEEIDDPSAKYLRIDFVKRDLIPLENQISITVFYPAKYSELLNPETYSFQSNEFIQEKNGIKVITPPLFAKGVSRLFVDTVQEMLQVVIIAEPQADGQKIHWNAQFIYPHELENRYVTKILSENPDESLASLQPKYREEYLRNRFRNYINQFRLYTSDDRKLFFDVEFSESMIKVSPQNIL